MEIQIPSSPRPLSNALGRNCRHHFRVAARRQTPQTFPRFFSRRCSAETPLRQIIWKFLPMFLSSRHLDAGSCKKARNSA